jgi:hypothetical protein
MIVKVNELLFNFEFLSSAVTISCSSTPDKTNSGMVSCLAYASPSCPADQGEHDNDDLSIRSMSISNFAIIVRTFCNTIDTEKWFKSAVYMPVMMNK